MINFFNSISETLCASNKVQTCSQRLLQLFDKLRGGYKDLALPIDIQRCQLTDEIASVKEDLGEKEEARLGFCQEIGKCTDKC